MESRGIVPIPTPPPFEPHRLAAWLGAPVALLSRPAALCHYADQVQATVRHVNHPVAVVVDHRFDSADASDPAPPLLASVSTRLVQAASDYQRCTVAHHVSETLFGYQHRSGERAGARWTVSPTHREPEAQQILARIGRLREDFSPLWMPIDGTIHEGWSVTSEPDETTGVALYGIGGSVGEVLVAVVGPADLLGDVALTTVQQRQGS
jgi:hypothetical protein